MPRLLSNWLDAYLEYTKNTQPKVSYKTWCALSAIASVLQRKCYMQLGSETFYPNMYVVLVGPPAACKGTAMRPARGILNRIGITLAADEVTRQKLVKNLIDAGATHADTSGNVYMHSSLTIFSTELTVFLGYQEIDFLTILCKWYDCEDLFVYDTLHHGKQEVSNVWVNLIGATTPMLLQSSLPASLVGGGFASRTVFVYEDSKEKKVVIPSLPIEIEDALVRDLGHIHTMCGRFTYDEDCMKLYKDWYLSDSNAPKFADPRLDYYLQRRQVHLWKLIMLLSAARDDSMVMTAEDFLRAESTLTSAEHKMPYVFQGTGANPLSSVQLRIMKMIAEEKELSYKDLLVAFMDDASGKDIYTIVSTLEEMRYCKFDMKNRMVRYTKKEG